MQRENLKINYKKILLYLSLIICLIQTFIIIIFFLNYKGYTDNNDNNEFFNQKRHNIGSKNYDNLHELFLFKKDNNTNDNYTKKEIHISMSLDDKTIYPTLVSMTSALENNDKDNNIIVYYLLLSHDFNISNIEIFESLREKFIVRINYYIIPNIFKYIYKWRETFTVYYKLLLSLLFPELDRIIFLDGDTLIFKDILEMYNLPFNGNYVLGYPFHCPWMTDFLGIKVKYYINGGVLLFNIKELRRTNKDIELLKYTLNNYYKVGYLEQDTLNYVFYNKIGLLPLKYGVYLFGNFRDFINGYLYKYRVKIDLKEMKEAIKDPAIVHLCCCTPKVWYKNSKQDKNYNYICKKYHSKFYYYAKKTKYYEDIYNTYIIKEKYKDDFKKKNITFL